MLHHKDFSALLCPKQVKISTSKTSWLLSYHWLAHWLRVNNLTLKPHWLKWAHCVIMVTSILPVQITHSLICFSLSHITLSNPNEFLLFHVLCNCGACMAMWSSLSRSCVWAMVPTSLHSDVKSCRRQLRSFALLVHGVRPLTALLWTKSHSDSVHWVRRKTAVMFTLSCSQCITTTQNIKTMNTYSFGTALEFSKVCLAD